MSDTAVGGGTPSPAMVASAGPEPPLLSLEGSQDKAEKKRCAVCRRKLTLIMALMSDCRCKGVFCPEHRAADAHACLHDAMERERARLATQLGAGEDRAAHKRARMGL